MLRSLLTTCALLSPLSVLATVQQVPIVGLTGLDWTVTGAGAIGYAASCSDLSLDLNGSPSLSGRFALYGTFNCAGVGSYTLIGSGYLTDAGTIGLNLNVGLTLWSCSLTKSTLSGSCTVTTDSDVTAGTIQLTYAQ
jgi:hypothetical protein